MPAPPAAQAVVAVAANDDGPPAATRGDEPTMSAPTATPAVPAGRRNGARRSTVAGGGGALERQVFEVLRGSTRPLAISAIRERIDSQPTGQEVRRLLERAGDRVSRSADRPATYSLR
jgi:hypothetical protein